MNYSSSRVVVVVVVALIGWTSSVDAFTAVHYNSIIPKKKTRHPTFNSNTPLAALVDPSIVDPSNHLAITDIVSTSFFGLGKHVDFPIGTTIPPVSSSTADTTTTLSSLKAVAATASTMADHPSTREIILQGADNTNNSIMPIKLDSEQMNFYAQDFDIFSKLPLAALVYVLFDFFFLNMKRVTDEDQMMYMYDEDYYLEDDDYSDTPEKVTAFVGQIALRLVMALVVTYATVMTSKMTYHPHF